MLWIATFKSRKGKQELWIASCNGKLFKYQLFTTYSDFQTLIFGSVKALPVKSSVYGTLVGFLNVSNSEFGKEIVERTFSLLQEALNSHNLNDIRLLTRFSAELVNSNVLSPSHVLEILNHYLDVPSSEGNDHSSLQRADWFLLIVMQTLPWVIYINV